MKKFLKGFRFHKMDEMERHIVFRSQRNSYLFLVIALLIWSFYESYRVYAFHTKLNLIPCMLLVTAVVIQIFSQLVMERNAVKDDEDSYETTPLLKIIILICVIVSVIITIGAAIIFMSVKI